MNHGTTYGYRKGCRCAECLAAGRATSRRSQRAYRERHGGRSPNDRVTTRAATLAVSWVIRNHPDVWGELRERARQEVAAK